MYVVEDKNRKDVREILLRPIDGSPKGPTGLVDRRLFTGENKIRATLNTKTCLWTISYEAGTVPRPLKSKYTKFNDLLFDVTEYFKRRNIKVVEVRD